MSNITRIKLNTPVQFGSETISELTLREPTARDMRGINISFTGDGGGSIRMGDMLDLAAKLAGQPPSVIDSLSPTDAMEVMGIVGGFMQGGRTTG